MIHGEDTDDSRLKEDSDMDESVRSDHSESESSDMKAENNDGESDDSSDDLIELEDNPAFQEWFRQALDETVEMRDEKYQKYVDQGMNEERAKEKAHMKTSWAVQRIFFDKYRTHLWSSEHLKDDETHQELVEDLEQRMSDGKDVDKTLKRVIAKYRHNFDGLFMYDEDDETEEDTDDENDD